MPRIIGTNPAATRASCGGRFGMYGPVHSNGESIVRIVSVNTGMFDGFLSIIIICCSYKIEQIRFAYRHGVRSLGNKFI
jgi:hypothetical protein